MTGAQKLYFLNQGMTEKAEDLIKNFELKYNGYIKAWNFFNQRFDNKQLVICTLLLKKLIYLEAIKSPNACNVGT